jgi:hypothetical protein
LPDSARPLGWALAVLAGLLALAVALVRRRFVPRSEVGMLYLVSAAATRKAREISEIDAFAKRVGTASEELRQQIRRLRAGHHAQVKIYIDHSNFITTWNDALHRGERPLEHDVDWHVLPALLLEETGAWLTKMRKAPAALLYRGMHVYGTLFEDEYFRLLETMLRHEQTAPARLSLPIRLRKETVERWRQENEAPRSS